MRVKRASFFVAASLVLFSFVGNLSAGADNAEKQYYTKANIWYEKPQRIYSTNYHKGEIIPVGTKVSVEEMDDAIHFKEVDGEAYYILVHATKHNPIKINQLFDHYFSEKNVMAEGGEFHSFSKQEQENIKKGIIEQGMSKEAVLMSYGYPPEHKTPDLTADKWQYWDDRASRMEVYFKNNKLVEIIGGRKKTNQSK